MKNVFLLFIILTLLTVQSLAGSVTDSSLNKAKLYGVMGVTLGGFVYGHAFLNDLWWKGEKSSFHFNFKQDWKYSLGADKIGHFYFPYLVGNVYNQLFRWSGIEENKSILYSSGLALFYQTYIEIRDGFSKQYGFSWGDYGANLLGAAYPLLQHKYDLLKNFNFKISYYPSTRFRNNSHGSIIDDYESTYHWLSFNIKNLLSKKTGEYYPGFINLALGHGVKGLDIKGKHELYLALDWNLESLPGDVWILKFLKKTLNYYHLPSPAVRIYPDIAWFGLKF